MPYSSGTFSVVYNWTTESGASPIEIAKLDTQHEDFATGLSNCILRDGTGLPTAATPWNGQNITGVGTLSGTTATLTGAVTGGRVIVTDSTIPANGIYLSAANTLALASNSTLRASANSAGNWAFLAPGSGLTASFTGIANASIVGINDGTRTIGIGTDSANGTGFIGTTSAHGFDLYSGGSQRVRLGSAGNVTISAPSSGGHSVLGAASGTLLDIGDGTRTFRFTSTGGNAAFGTLTAHALNLQSDGTTKMSISTAGNVVIAAPSSGTALTAQNGVARAIDATGSVAFTMSSVVHTFAVDGSGAYQDIGGANAWRIYTNSVERLVVGSTGAVIVRAPTSGTALSVNTTAGGSGVTFSDGTVTGYLADFGATRHNFGTSSNHSSNWYSNNTQRVVLAAGGNVTINAADSGDELTVTGSVVATSFTGALTGNASTATALQTARTINGTSFNGTANITVTAAAETLTGSALPALSGASLTALNATQLTSGTVPSARITAVDAAATINSIAIGYRTIPQNAQTGNYTAVIGDSGYHIYHASGAGAGDTYTIPANASVAYPIGTVLTFVNNDSNSVSIAITTDTMTLAGTTTTGTRTLAQNGVATALKTTSTTWLISGTGLS